MVRIDGTPIGLADIIAVARSATAVTVADEVLERVAAGHRFAADTAAQRPIYGISTGVGANRSVAVGSDDPDGRAAHALRLIRSHATSGGPARSGERVRALLVIRLAQLAADGNGIDPDAVRGLARLLADDVPPTVREYGGLGTGDLSALATIGLSLVERGDWTPHTDALTFLSSNAAALADAALAVADLRLLAEAGLVVAALSVVGTRGNPEAFSAGVEAATPFPGARRVARGLRALLAADRPVAPARIQDSYGLRTLPQVYGPLLDALDRAEEVVVALANAPAENPMVSPVLGVAHHGGFHAAYLSQALDQVRSALAQALQGSLARTTMLSDPAVTGLTAFLAEDVPGASGTMVTEYVAASALADIRALAQPAGIQSVSISRATEDDASFASLAARQALAAVPATAVVLSAELVGAHRAVGLHAAKQSQFRLPDRLADLVTTLDGAGLAAGGIEDRDLTGDLDLAARLMPDLARLLPVPR